MSTLDKLLSHADTVVLRAMKDEEIPLLDRARLSVQLTLKKIAERTENVTVNLSLSDELMRRIMQRLDMQAEAAQLEEPADIYVTPTIEAAEPEPNDKA